MNLNYFYLMIKLYDTKTFMELKYSVYITVLELTVIFNTAVACARVHACERERERAHLSILLY